MHLVKLIFPSRLFLLVFFFPCFVYSSYYIKEADSSTQNNYNSIGQTGLIHLPSGSIQDTGSLGLTLGTSSLNQFISVIATPFPWLEASFFYHRPKDTFYASFDQREIYLDKGFNLKIGTKINEIDVAIGFDDIAGTGFFSKEYIAISRDLRNLKLTFGIGTGAFAAERPYKNPISRLKDRPEPLFGEGNITGGEVDFNSFFKGPIGIFGGIEYFSNRFPGLVIKIENNPFNYKKFLGGGIPTYKSTKNREKLKNFNYGVSYQFNNNFMVSISHIKGDTIDITLSKKFNFNNSRRKIQPKDIKITSNSKDNKLAFYQNILRNLEKDDLYLQSAQIDRSNNLHLSIVNNKYNDPVSVFQHTKLVIAELSLTQEIVIEDLTITNINSGLETGTMTGKLRNWLNPNELGYVDVAEPSNQTKELEFQTVLKFPEFYYDIKPEFIYRYADPTRFFAGGLDIQFANEIKFTPNIYVSSVISYQVTNSFKRLRYYPDSPYLYHVRTDVVKYLNNRPDIYLNNLQLDKLSKITNDHYYKLSAGMYEMMFGGFGIEYLWKPFRSNFLMGLNLYRVKQRDFNQRLKFRNYEITTGHANLIYFDPNSGVTIDLSLGKYLAGDVGYTIDFSKLFFSGFRMGAYFTRTNISKTEYGEGSFDKGFYFELPLNFFNESATKGISKIVIQPLTRDGGAKLKTNNPLIYAISSGNKNDYDFYLD